MTKKQEKVIEYLKAKISQKEEEYRKDCPEFYKLYETYSLEDKLLDLGGEIVSKAFEYAGYCADLVHSIFEGNSAGWRSVNNIIKLMEV